jgi:hypothetical protein
MNLLTAVHVILDSDSKHQTREAVTLLLQSQKQFLIFIVKPKCIKQ